MIVMLDVYFCPMLGLTIGVLVYDCNNGCRKFNLLYKDNLKVTLGKNILQAIIKTGSLVMLISIIAIFYRKNISQRFELFGNRG